MLATPFLGQINYLLIHQVKSGEGVWHALKEKKR